MLTDRAFDLHMQHYAEKIRRGTLAVLRVQRKKVSALARDYQREVRKLAELETAYREQYGDETELP